MLNYNEIKPRKYIVVDGEPYEVVDNHVARKSQGKPSNQTKLKSLLNRRVVEMTFHASDTVQEAEIETRDIKYLYQKGNEIWFCSAEDAKDRFTVELSIIERELAYIKQNDVVPGTYFGEQLIGVKIPMKVTLSVSEAAPAVKGNTATGATKRVKLENGLEVVTPLFIKEGDKVVVNTDTNEYVERA